MRVHKKSGLTPSVPSGIYYSLKKNVSHLSLLRFWINQDTVF